MGFEVAAEVGDLGEEAGGEAVEATSFTTAKLRPLILEALEISMTTMDPSLMIRSLIPSPVITIP